MRRRPPQRTIRFALSFNPLSVMSVRLENFYNFRNLRDVTRYKMRLQDALHSTGSTRLPRVTLIRHAPPGPTNCDAN